MRRFRGLRGLRGLIEGIEGIEGIDCRQGDKETRRHGDMGIDEIGKD